MMPLVMLTTGANALEALLPSRFCRRILQLGCVCCGDIDVVPRVITKYSASLCTSATPRGVCGHSVMSSCLATSTRVTLFVRRCCFSLCLTMSCCNFHTKHGSSSSATHSQVSHYRKLAKESEAQVEQVSGDLFVASIGAHKITQHRSGANVLLTRDERMVCRSSHT